MIYAQIKSGRKLHLVMQQGEMHRGHTMRAGELSNPICGQKVRGNYRMHPMCKGPSLIAGHRCRLGDMCDNDSCWVPCPFCVADDEEILFQTTRPQPQEGE